MKSLSEINVSDVFIYFKDLFNKTSKTKKIFFVILVLLVSLGYVFGKEWWIRYNLSKDAQTTITKIAQVQQDFLKLDGQYKKDLFKDKNLANALGVKLEKDLDPFGMGQRRSLRSRRNQQQDSDYNIGYSHNFLIEIDPENACLVLKYKKNTDDKTFFYASFKNALAFCQGKKCPQKVNENTEGLCYVNDTCFTERQDKETTRSCGDGKGEQTRKCVASCAGGTCSDWSECNCKKGFEWDGKTCKQTQTEKDCTSEQCYNGTYCEDKEPIEKNVENGTCKRYAICQKNTGWSYTSWECSCANNDFCPVNDQCLPYPGDKNKITLPNQEGSCTNVYYACEKNVGWKAKARNCVCEKIGTFWDPQKKNAECSACTNKPVGAIFTSAAKDKDNCAWDCANEYQRRNGTCLKPNGQYLCVQTALEICTDEFSKNRKMKESEQTNEGQSCYVEDKDNVLFFNKKDKICTICQCVDLTNGKISN